jgi:transcriptional regulator with AAA-type ATPase domain
MPLGMTRAGDRFHTTAPGTATTAEKDPVRLGVEWVFPRVQRLDVHESVLLGRGDECDCPLGGEQTSRRHARLAWDGPVLVVEDLESRNGTFVNGARVGRSPVTSGDVLRLGEWVGVVVPLVSPYVPFGALAPNVLGGARLASVLAPLRQVARSGLPVIIEGATGTGKEVVARALHTWSGRSGRLLAVNCAALPESMAEAEFFGYRRGAFTGAERDSPGYFRAARHGTLLLDEFTELPPALQTKLLRVLECGEVVPLGESTPVAVDPRVVVAAQESVAGSVEQGRVREDLYARLNGLTVVLPCLAERREDIVLLFSAFLRDAGSAQKLDPRFAELISRYHWPLNIREVVLTVQRLVQLHGDKPILKRSHLPETIAAQTVDGPDLADAEDSETARPQRLRRSQQELAEERAQRDRQETEALRAQLAQCEGSVSQAATVLGISRQRAYRLLRRSGVDGAPLGPPEEERNGS